MDMRDSDGSPIDVSSDGGISIILAPAVSSADLRCWSSGDEHIIHGCLPVPFL